MPPQLAAIQSSTSCLTVNTSDCLGFVFRVLFDISIRKSHNQHAGTDMGSICISDVRLHGAADMEVAQATRMLRQVVGTAGSYKEIFLKVGSVIHSLILCPCMCVGYGAHSCGPVLDHSKGTNK